MDERTNHHGDGGADEALARLRAGDPAAGVEPDLSALRSEVESRRGGVVVDLARARSRRRALSIGTAAAAAMVLGAVGFGVGRATGPEEVPAAAPAITLGGGATEEAAAADAQRGADSASAIYPAPWMSHTTFRAEGLGDEPGTAPAWGYDATARWSGETAAAVGAAAGLDGEPRLESGMWLLGSQDGTGPSLSISPDGATSVSFYDPTKETFRCAMPEPLPDPEPMPEPAPPEMSEPAPADDGGSGSSEGSAPSADSGAGTAGQSDPAIAPDDCGPVDLGPAPSQDAAIEQARSVLVAAGLDPASFEMEVPELGDPSMIQVTAWQVVDGVRTGQSWYFALTGAGMQSFGGYLAPLTPLGDYPIVGPATAVERLMDPRFSSTGVIAMMAEAGSEAAAKEDTGPDAAVSSPVEPPSEPPAPVQPGAAVAWPVEEVAITGAQLGSAYYQTPSGAALLLPAYELSSDDGRTWSVVAVAEEALDLATP